MNNTKGNNLYMSPDTVKGFQVRYRSPEGDFDGLVQLITVS